MTAAEMRDALLDDLHGHRKPSMLRARLDAYAAQVAAETRAGLVSVDALRQHHRHTVRVVLMADDKASLWCRSCDEYLLPALPAPEPPSAAAPVLGDSLGLEERP